MRRLVYASAVLTTTLAVMPAVAGNNNTGNGAPSGAHYDLNVIGVDKSKTAPMTGSDRHTVFVPLTGNCRIGLTEGDFQVLDGNCTDGPADFQLPNPDPDGDGTTAYTVYARALGQPGGGSTTTTCFTDTSGATYCSMYSMVLTRSTGKSSFTDVSKELLYVYYCDTSTGRLTRTSLFSDSWQSGYWDYTNDGLRLAQLRFYEQPTTVDPISGSC